MVQGFGFRVTPAPSTHRSPKRKLPALGADSARRTATPSRLSAAPGGLRRGGETPHDTLDDCRASTRHLAFGTRRIARPHDTVRRWREKPKRTLHPISGPRAEVHSIAAEVATQSSVFSGVPPSPQPRCPAPQPRCPAPQPRFVTGTSTRL
jgi:hypothetical protein